MIRQAPAGDPDAPIIVIDIGNTSIGIATWHKGRLKTPLSAPTEDQAAFDRAYAAHREALPAGRPAAIVIGSVVPPALARIRTCVEKHEDRSVLVVGDAICLPMDVAVVDAKAIGVDRVCAAAAAYERLQTGCVVVDFGTAVTVDLVDDEGVLRGGAILPGLNMQFRALHDYTSGLPQVEPSLPEQPYGRDTREAIQAGVCRGLAGAVRALVEAYATALNRWLQVVATGGDVGFMAPHCDFLDTLADHLALQGIGLAYQKHLEAGGA